MKLTTRIFRGIGIAIILTTMSNCQKDSSPEVQSDVLFSVDLASGSFNNGYEQAYLAAYTPDGELLGYGNITDSTKWNLIGKYAGDKIDILLIDIWHENTLNLYHYTDVPVGQSFSDQGNLALARKDRMNQHFNSSRFEGLQQMGRSAPPLGNESTVPFNLKVEDFGNRTGNTTGTNSYESYAYFHSRGVTYPYGEIFWDKVENGYSFMQRNLTADSVYQGFVLNLLERGTNDAYSYYSDQSLANFTISDTLTLHKEDFTKGLLKTINVTSSSNDYNNIFLYTFNLQNGKRDLITSFDIVTPTNNGKTLRYFTGNNIPINKWQLAYTASYYKTCYFIVTNRPIPATIEVKELVGQSINKVGDHFELTHSSSVTSSTLTQSIMTFVKQNDNIFFSYYRYFYGNQSDGTSSFKLLDIPKEILAEHNGFVDFDNTNSWIDNSYSQTYSNIPGYTPVDDLKARLGITAASTVINEDYAMERFSIGL